MPSLAERRRKRRGRATAAGAVEADALSVTKSPAGNGIVRSTSSSKLGDVTTATTTVVQVMAAADGGESQGVMNTDSSKVNTAEESFDADGHDDRAEETADEARHLLTQGMGRSQRICVKSGVKTDDSRNDMRLRRRPSYKIPVDSGLPGGNSSSRVTPTSSRSRIRTESEDTAGKIKLGERRRHVMTSASLKTLSLREMEERKSLGNSGHGDDALDT